MSAIEIVIEKAKATAGVTAFTTRARLYAYELPQTIVMPCVVFNVVSGSDAPYLGGAAGMRYGIITCECIGGTPDAAHNLAQALINGLHGTVNAEIAGKVNVSILLQDEHSDSSNDRSSFRCTVDLRVRYKQ